MKKRRQEQGDERRRERVEINLADESEDGGRLSQGSRRGCALPFGVWALAFVALLAAHLALGVF